MEPAKLDDRELGCIDFFLFCFLLSSGLVWAPSWAILAPSWATLASSWAILAPSWLHLGPSGLHLGSPKPPEACPDLTRLFPEAPRCSPEAPRAKNYKSATKASRRDRFLDKSSKKSEGQILSRNLLKRSLLEDFAQSVQKITK